MNITFNHQIDFAPVATHWLLGLEVTGEITREDFDVEKTKVIAVNVLNDDTNIYDDEPIIDKEFLLSIQEHFTKEINAEMSRHDYIHAVALHAADKQTECAVFSNADVLYNGTN